MLPCAKLETRYFHEYCHTAERQIIDISLRFFYIFFFFKNMLATLAQSAIPCSITILLMFVSKVPDYSSNDPQP